MGGINHDKSMYALLTTTPFRLPIDPEPLAIYYPTPMPLVDNAAAPVLDLAGQPTFNVPVVIDCATQATIDSRFSRARNYWLSYTNIRRAVYNLLDNTESGNGGTRDFRPNHKHIWTTKTPVALLQNDMLFRSVYFPQDAPEILFWRIEDCQEVQILGEDPYTAQQLLNKAVRLLLQCGIPLLQQKE